MKKDVKENNKTLKLSYIPEHDGAKGEWMAEMEKILELQSEINIRDIFAFTAMNGLLSKCHPDQIINRYEIAKDAYDLADAMLKERDR
tara:strand:+ start:204 stop:467 length:264 start_codon:yes stop_codon:yes gene_type:complete